MAEELSHNRDAYIRAWRHVLSGWLSWPEERIQKFISIWDRVMWDWNSLFYTEVPTYYVVPLLIPDALRQELKDEVIRLDNRLHVAIDFKPKFIDRPERFMWGSARHRVLAVLEEYGASLPLPDDPYVSHYLHRDAA